MYCSFCKLQRVSLSGSSSMETTFIQNATCAVTGQIDIDLGGQLSSVLDFLCYLSVVFFFFFVEVCFYSIWAQFSSCSHIQGG